MSKYFSNPFSSISSIISKSKATLNLKFENFVDSIEDFYDEFRNANLTTLRFRQLKNDFEEQKQFLSSCEQKKQETNKALNKQIEIVKQIETKKNKLIIDLLAQKKLVVSSKTIEDKICKDIFEQNELINQAELEIKKARQELAVLKNCYNVITIKLEEAEAEAKARAESEYDAIDNNSIKNNTLFEKFSNHFLTNAKRNNNKNKEDLRDNIEQLEQARFEISKSQDSLSLAILDKKENIKEASTKIDKIKTGLNAQKIITKEASAKKAEIEKEYEVANNNHEACLAELDKAKKAVEDSDDTYNKVSDKVMFLSQVIEKEKDNNTLSNKIFYFFEAIGQVAKDSFAKLTNTFDYFTQDIIPHQSNDETNSPSNSNPKTTSESSDLDPLEQAILDIEIGQLLTDLLDNTKDKRLPNAKTHEEVLDLPDGLDETDLDLDEDEQGSDLAEKFDSSEGSEMDEGNFDDVDLSDELSDTSETTADSSISTDLVGVDNDNTIDVIVA